MPLCSSWLLRLLRVEPGERTALVWSFAYFFLLLAAYYVLRPVRTEMAVQTGVKNLPWLFSATFLISLAIQPLFGWLTARFPRARLLPAIYAFFALNLLAFYMVFGIDAQEPIVAKTFSFGFRCSTYSWCRCSGALWRTCFVRDKGRAYSR